MKKTPYVLFFVGCAFFIQAGIVMSLFDSETQKMMDSTNMADVHIAVNQHATGQMVSSAIGSIVGCFGCWLILLYLKIRKLERELAELRGKDH
jgi:hypothetical protein